MVLDAKSIFTLQELYRVQDDKTVIAFLNDNPELSPLLLETYSQIAIYFHDPQCYLELLSDPEINLKQLLLSIVTHLNLDEAIQKLDEFREDWWLDNLPRAQGKLLIDVDSI
jgi:hypothetical protein